MVMMQNDRTTPMADSEAGMRSLRMSHVIVRVLLVLSLLESSTSRIGRYGNYRYKCLTPTYQRAIEGPTAVVAEKIAILAKTEDLRGLDGNKVACKVSSIWKSSRNTDTLFPKMHIGFFGS
jgi:hypothetical protein